MYINYAHRYTHIYVFLYMYAFGFVAPSASPVNVEGIVLSSTSILLSWDAPPPHHQNGLIHLYAVNVTEEETGKEFGVTAQNTSATLESLHPNYHYRFTVTAVTVLPGPPSSEITIRTDEDGS